MTRQGSLRTCFAVYAVAFLVAWLSTRFMPPALGPLWTAGAADLAATLVVFAGSVMVNKSSMYDPYWSVAPPLLVLYWIVAYSAPLTPCTVVLIVLVCVWAIRLTVNCLVRWRGITHEDWRYAQFRGNRLYWPISFAGFHLMPTVVVFAGCVPVALALSSGVPACDAAAWAALLLTASAIALEWIADVQLARFLQSSAGSSPRFRGGVWRILHHPNYVGEMLFWCGVGLWGFVNTSGAWWTLAGTAAITILFLAISIPMMNRRLKRRTL